MSFFTPDIFLRPELLFGAALAVVPILLHLLMRTKPKKLIFPALRLIVKRKKTNVRRIKLRHLWLLLLRIAVIILIVLAIARPSLPAANYSLSFYETAMLIGVVALSAGVYFGLMARWRKQRLPHHDFIYRRSLLRGGTGVMIVLLLLLLVFWPYRSRIAAEIEAPAADLTEDLPIAAVFLFDTSLSMEYRREGKTRLEEAQEIAGEYLSKLPLASRVAVGGTASDQALSFREDLTVARGDVQSLKTAAVSVPLNQRVREALRAQEDDLGRTLESQAAVPEENRQDQYLREIYLFTDLSETAWKQSAAKLLQKEIDRLKFVNIYVIDLGDDDPKNVVIDSLKLSSQSISIGTPLSVDVTLSATGTGEVSRTVEILATNAAGKLITQGKRSVTIKPGEKVEESFQLTDLAQPFAEGEVRIGEGEPLDADNRRFFTIGTRLPPRILIVEGEKGDGDFLKEALAPIQLEQIGRARFRVDQQSAVWLDENLKENGDAVKNYSVVCLVNVPAPKTKLWNSLADYTGQGGGLAIFLGSDDIQSTAYNTAAAQSLVPGELFSIREFDDPGPETLNITARDHGSHPIFSRLCSYDQGKAAAEFSQRPVFECWYVEPAEDASVVAWFTQQHYPAPTPALIERRHGQGRVVMLTTGVTHKRNRLDWSLLAKDNWQFLVVAEDLMNYLGRQASRRYNYQAGEEARILLDSENKMETYLLRMPDESQQSRSVPAGAQELTLVETRQPGHYRVLDPSPDSDFEVGFSVNAPAEESDLTKISKPNLDEMFGEERYRVTRNLDELERIVNVGRLGEELFPQVLVLVIVAFCAEHLVSNRFYEADQQPERE